MPATKKYKVPPVTFSFRADAKMWEDFVMALMLEKDTPTAFLTRTMMKYLDSRQSLLTAVKQAVESVQVDTNEDSLPPIVSNAETVNAIRETETVAEVPSEADMASDDISFDEAANGLFGDVAQIMENSQKASLSSDTLKLPQTTS